MLDAALHRPVSAPVGRVLQVHGITADLDQGGMFERLAIQLASRGFDVLRFSFRGHGRSSGEQRGVTIGGEMLDFLTAYDYLEDVAGGESAVVAVSFGAVPTSLVLNTLPRPPRALVYWNPVLDLHDTFLEPTLPWGHRNFGDHIRASLEAHGYVDVEGVFELGPTIFAEMSNYDVRAAFVSSDIPALVIHCDEDSYVSYAVAQDASRQRPNTQFETVRGSDHLFDGREREDAAIDPTCDWLSKQFAAVHTS
jgi:uncharacterized protein